MPVAMSRMPKSFFRREVSIFVPSREKQKAAAQPGVFGGIDLPQINGCAGLAGKAVQTAEWMIAQLFIEGEQLRAAGYQDRAAVAQLL